MARITDTRTSAGWGTLDLDRVVVVLTIGFHRKGTSEQKLKEAEECAGLIPGNSVLVRRNSPCKGPRAGACLGALRDSKEARVAGVA